MIISESKLRQLIQRAMIHENLNIFDGYKKAEAVANATWPNDSKKADPHRHMLASAIYGQKYGKLATLGAGYGVEAAGVLKKLSQGKLATSGWAQDMANNRIGVNIGLSNPNASIKLLNRLVKDRIKAGNFYVEDGMTLHKDKKEQKK